MTDAAADGRWRLDHDGHRLQVETRRVGWTRIVRLYVDGVQHAQARALNQARIPYGHSTVQVDFDTLGLLDGQAARCVLAPPRPADQAATNDTDTHDADHGEDRQEEDGKDDDVSGKGDGDGGREKVAFTPPEGTRAARRELLARRHPTLYASRHVVVATGKVVLGILGVSALIGAVIRLLVSYLPRPDVDLPDIDPPDLPIPDIPWPDIDPPDVMLPAWLQAILATTKYWIPILIAIGVAVHEVDKRKKQERQRRQEHQDRRRPPDAPNTDTGADSGVEDDRDPGERQP